MLDLARIEAGKVELFPDSVSLPGLLRNVTDVIRINAQDKDLMFSFEAPHDLPSIVRADEKRLGQVLLNLLSNAVKFTERGRVSLRVQRLASSDDSACLRFAVEDTGIGIAHEQIATIFRPFEQAMFAVFDPNRAGSAAAADSGSTSTCRSRMRHRRSCRPRRTTSSAATAGHGARCWWSTTSSETARR